MKKKPELCSLCYANPAQISEGNPSRCCTARCLCRRIWNVEPLSILFILRTIFYHLKKSCSPLAWLGNSWNMTANHTRATPARCFARSWEKTKWKMHARLFSPCSSFSLCIRVALDEALLTLKNPPEGEFNAPAAFQLFSSHLSLLLFSSSDLPLLSLMPRAPFRAEEGAKARPLKYFFIFILIIVFFSISTGCCKQPFRPYQDRGGGAGDCPGGHHSGPRSDPGVIKVRMYTSGNLACLRRKTVAKREVKHLPKHATLPYGSSSRETSKSADDNLIFIQTWRKNAHP